MPGQYLIGRVILSNAHGVLYIVATPIGNLSDISDRARRVLGEVDGVFAEDTRRSGRLLKRLGILASLTSFHAHNETHRAKRVIERLERGENLALISDAGTPVISDPGGQLVREVLERGIRVVPLPGPCALICALSASGVNASKFVFEGFLSPSPVARRSRLKDLSEEKRTVVFYEAPHRIEGLLSDLLDTFGADRTATVARELTKTFETILAGTLAILSKTLSEDENHKKGEFVVVVSGRKSDVADDTHELERILSVLLEDMPVKQAVSTAVKLTKMKKNHVYRVAMALSSRKAT